MTKLPADFSLRPDQWHLSNQGQTGGTAGIDINVLPVWEDYTGNGVKVVVFDSGIDTGHPDLIGNYLPELSYEYTTGTTDGSYLHVKPYEAHGTFVSGLIAADGSGTGFIGVAFGAKFTAYANFGTNESSTAFSRAADAGFDVMNNSWGYTIPFVATFHNDPSLLDNLTHAVSTGRDGLGLNILFAAGNSYSYSRIFAEHGFTWTGQSPFADVNTDSLQNSRFIITVGSVDHDGTYSEPGDDYGYTTPGAAVLVSAPGTNVTSTDIRGPDGYGPGDDYTSSGTSFATPVVSGIVALMLEANPLLGYRDVKEILAYSARHIDPEEPAWMVNGATNHNGGGLLSNYNYGFGMVDATAAVRLAETWTKQSVYSNEVYVGTDLPLDNVAIPDGGAIQFTFELADGVSIETMELDLSLVHEEIGDLTLTLISPNGTESTLLYRPSDGRVTEITKAIMGDGPGSFDATKLIHTLTSNEFMGETSGGTWTVVVTDEKLGNVGSLQGFELRAYGSNASADRTYIYTNDFAMVAGTDAARTTLANSTGTHTLNLAAVSDAVVVNLATGAANIAGVDVTITANTKVGTVFAGDGADLVTLSSAVGFANMGRGNDTVVVTSTGTINGGAGFDRIVLSDTLAQYTLDAGSATVQLTHKDSGDLITASNVQFFAFADNPSDVLVLTASAVEAQVARLYDLVLGRAADFDGLAYWIGRAAEGAGVGDIAASFSASDEFSGLSASLSNSAFIDLLYTHILGRSADESGASYWMGRIEAGINRLDIATSFAVSDEAGTVTVDHVRLIGTAEDTLFA